MKIRKKQARRNTVLIATAVLLCVASAGVVYYLLANSEKELVSRVETQPSNNAKDNLDKSSQSTAGLPENTATTTTEQVPTDTDVSIVIDSFSQDKSKVTSVANTNGDGTCVFMYEPADGGKPVTRQVSTTNNKCQVSISNNEFAYLGEWKLTVTYYNEGKKNSSSQTLIIN